ncbi:N-6 DNA methylase [Halobacillus halophilus]|uniref:N-6 DNA methylase n=1 Tax=Halobacillus halophilus TaxID=1570 RepID=UPI0013686971|nr:N-6 DNA methylase [Halobacillus halophilus]
MVEKLFWSFADSLRGYVNTSETRLICASLLTLDYVSNKREFYGIPSNCTISHIIQNSNHVDEEVMRALETLEHYIQPLEGVFRFSGIFTKINPNDLFEFLLKLENVDIKVEEYRFIIEEVLGSEEEYNTPKSINTLGIKLLNIEDGTFYDGSFGTGGSVISAKNFAEGKGINLDYYGQEVNQNTWALGKLNLFLHGIDNANIKLGNTLLDPRFINNNGLMKFNYTFMNFPFGMRLNRHSIKEYDPYNRFVYGPVSKSTSDSAFIQHAIASMNDLGKATLVVTNGVLFRAHEKVLRKNLLFSDLVDAVIALPENLYEYTSIQTNLLLLNRNKPEERKGKVLFINAVNEYQETRRNRRILSEEDIDKIYQSYVNSEEIEKFSKIVPISDISEANLLCDKYLEDDEVKSDEFGVVKVSQEKFGNIEGKRGLGDIAEIYRGINLTPKQLIEGNGNYKIIKLSDVENGEISVDNINPVEIKIQKKLDSYIANEGDLIISCRGAKIKVAVVPQHEGNLILSQNFHGLRVKNDIDPYFLKAYLESPVGQFLLEGIQTGTSIKNINIKDLKNLYVPILSIEHQKDISKRYRKAKEDYLMAVKKAQEQKINSLLTVYEDMGISGSMNIQ